MHLTRLQIHNLRNLLDVVMIPHPQFNLFIGQNGSGKTSLLEAIHLLAQGRSFRSRQVQVIISYERSEFTCYGEVIDENQAKIPLGIEKSRSGDVTCKVAGEICDKLSAFATTLPIQLITPETFKLLQAGPEERRRFLDWGVFHVEPLFTELCQRYQRLLKQRNAALKQNRGWQTLQVWEKELAQIGEQLTEMRQRYLTELTVYIDEALQSLLPGMALSFAFDQGWQAGLTLEEAFKAALRNDERWGYTSVGPQRAELIVKCADYAAKEVLSRGQQKLLICALHLAQAKQLLMKKGKKCIYLIDDLASELDTLNRQRLLAALAKACHQTFLTGVDPQGWEDVLIRFDSKMFHVEQGNVISTSTVLTP